MKVTTLTSEMNATEMGRKGGLPDERIKKLEAINRKLTDSMRKKAEKRVKELIQLQIQIPYFRGLQ